MCWRPETRLFDLISATEINKNPRIEPKKFPTKSEPKMMPNSLITAAIANGYSLKVTSTPQRAGGLRSNNGRQLFTMETLSSR